ncbi:MAG TPA: hypothetical protein VF669_18570 [Tepidisphaeraceae bacterium]|jgi:anti-sigma factor RsiW
MTREQLEYQISQYVDHTLSTHEKAALEHRLGTDVEAQQILAEYRSINDMLRTQLPTMEEVNWEQFASATSRAVDEADADAPPVTYRIFTWSRMAVAASVLLAGGIAFLTFRSGNGASGPQPVPAAPSQVVRIDGPAAEPSTQPAVAQISVGPATELAETQYPLDGIVYQPSRVSLIATPDDTMQDTHRSPYQR